MGKRFDDTPMRFFDEATRCRFWSKVDMDASGGCWVWRASRIKGYGQVGGSRKGVRWNMLSHRAAFLLSGGIIPAGFTLDHLCRNRSCVNPAHLEPISNRENILRGVGASAQHARATHCPQGHPYDAENTYLRRDKPGRECRACARDRSAAHYRGRHRA